jgi:uncharacterized membrane protein YqjE
VIVKLYIVAVGAAMVTLLILTALNETERWVRIGAAVMAVLAIIATIITLVAMSWPE